MDAKNVSGKIIASADVETIRELVQSAVSKGADLSNADLCGADLHRADLYGANLSSANLSNADLRSADLRHANLYGANLYGANLRRADLSGADLYGANLSSANLRSANLYSAEFAPTNILRAEWGELSDELVADLMELDASAHPDRSAFDRWAQGGPCPYVNTSVLRVVNFRENRAQWGKGKLDTIYNSMIRIFKEKGVKF